MKDVLHALAIQRNELRNALAEVIDKIQSGAYNGMFREENPREDDDPKAKCEKGHTRDQVIWCCGRICKDCDGCRKHCHLAFEEKRLFDEMRKATKLLRERDAEMPEITPESFPVYDPKKYVYETTDRWVVRNLYRFAVGYWLFADHESLENEKSWERAFDDLLTLALNHVGRNGETYRTFVSKINEYQEKGPYDKAKAEKLREEHPEVVALLSEAVDRIYAKKKEAVTVLYLVYHALTLRMDYQFGHKYPGGDMDVYDGAFCSLIDVALKLADLDGDDEPWQQDDESDDAYRYRLADAKAKKHERIYAFIQEQDGLTRKNLE